MFLFRYDIPLERMNIPIYLTLFRILCIPVLVFFLLFRFYGHELIALAIYVIAALTDIADGVLARRTQQISTLGELMDPVADKLLISSALICLVGMGRVAPWAVVIIISREIAVSGFRAVASSRGINISSSVLGKIKMWCEAITVGLLILGKENLGRYFILAEIGLGLVLAVVIISAVEYFMKFGKLVISGSSPDRQR
jgi:CDP-diacylglycerol--glycerol-3-phosphate 3-phosphatidyltransferase